MLSAIAAALPDGNGPAKDLHYCENQLRASGHTDRTSRVLLPGQRRQRSDPGDTGGIFPNFLPSADFACPMIATQDVA
jgi:hypothetical protein